MGSAREGGEKTVQIITLSITCLPSPESGSFHGLRLRCGMRGWEQGSMSLVFSVRENTSAGTRAMRVLSQMMRDREMTRRCFFWVLVNTPSLSHQNLESQTQIQIRLLVSPTAFIYITTMVDVRYFGFTGLHLSGFWTVWLRGRTGAAQLGLRAQLVPR